MDIFQRSATICKPLGNQPLEMNLNSYPEVDSLKIRIAKRGKIIFVKNPPKSNKKSTKLNKSLPHNFLKESTSDPNMATILKKKFLSIQTGLNLRISRGCRALILFL